MDIGNINFIHDDDGFVQYIQPLLSQWCNNTMTLRLYSYKNIPKEELDEIKKINRFKDTLKLEYEDIHEELDMSQVKMFALYYNNNDTNNSTFASSIHFQKTQKQNFIYISNTPAVYANKKLNTVLRCILVLYIYLAMHVSRDRPSQNNYLISEAINPASANILLFPLPSLSFLFGEKDIYFKEGRDKIFINKHQVQELCDEAQRFPINKNKNLTDKNECMQYLFQNRFYGVLYIHIECHYENAKIALQLLEHIIREYDASKCISATNGGKRRKSGGKKHTRRRRTKKRRVK